MYISKEKDLLSNQLKVMLKEHETGFAGEYKIAWKSMTRTTVDTEKLKEKLGDSYAEYTKESRFRRLSVA